MPVPELIAAAAEKPPEPDDPAFGEAFERFPTWMWRNTDVDAFVGWLRNHNRGRAYEEMAGFYGLQRLGLADGGQGCAALAAPGFRRDDGLGALHIRLLAATARP